MHIASMRSLSIAASFLCLFLFSACGSKNEEAAPRSVGAGRPLMVSGIVVQPQPLDNVVRSSGTVLASESVDLCAETAGRVEKITFKEGAHVGKNVLLVKINDDDLQAQLQKIELQISLSDDQEKRQRQMYEKHLVSKEQYDISLNQLKQQKADRDNLLAAIRKKEIRTPFDGIIGLRYVSEGSYVTQTTRIASLQKINPLKIDFAIPEKYAGDVSIGDPVRFSNDEAGLHFTGAVYAIEPKIDAATRTLQLRARCENKSEKILPGAYVQVDLSLRQVTNALLVPTQAIVPVLKGQTLLLAKGGIVVPVPVKTGIRTATSVQITSGISAGDTVITTGIMQLRPGKPVNVKVK